MGAIVAAMDLDMITTKLGKVYRTSKDSEKELKVERQEFFKACTEAVETDYTLAQKTIKIPPHGQGDVEAYIAKWYPGWQIITAKAKTAVIEEDPAYQKFIHVNLTDGQVYNRNVTQATDSLDDELLQAKDPTLWKRITRPSMARFNCLLEFEEWADDEVIKGRVKDFLATQEEKRELISLDELSEKDIDALAEYVVPGPLSLKLEPVRKAKPSELDG